MLQILSKKFLVILREMIDEKENKKTLRISSLLEINACIIRNIELVCKSNRFHFQRRAFAKCHNVTTFKTSLKC